MPDEAMPLPNRVSDEDALRLDNLLMRKDLLLRRHGEEQAAMAERIADYWNAAKAKYRLADDDEINAETGAITRKA